MEVLLAGGGGDWRVWKRWDELCLSVLYLLDKMISSVSSTTKFRVTTCIRVAYPSAPRGVCGMNN